MLSDDELERYARQAIMPNIGEEGQERLLASSALIVGAGGLGSPVVALLAAAGFGHLRIVDPDHVSLSNLNRQFIHRTDRLAAGKAQSAADFATGLNPAIRIEAIAAALTLENAAALIDGQDMVLDCTDQMATRQLIAAAARQAGRPHIFGGAVQMSGQLCVFCAGMADHPDSPCFGCLFPRQPGPDLAPNCAQAGILGPVVSVIGSLMAGEAIKLAAGLDGVRPGRLLLYDGQLMQFDQIECQRDPACAICAG